MKTKNINLKSIFCSAIISLSFMAINAQVTDNGMTHDFHKQNVGKIVFSTSEIIKSTQSAESLTNTFNLGDDIYGRVYLAKSLTNELVAISGDSYRYKITVDGKPLASSFFDGNITLKFAQDVADKWTTFQVALSPTTTEGYTANEFSGFISAIWELSAGAHKVKYELMVKGASKESTAAAGEFTLNVTEDGKTKASNKVCPMISGWYAMDASMVSGADKLVEDSKKSGEKVLKVVIMGSDWKYSKDANGNIKNRWMSGMAFYQDLKTKLCYDVEAIFVQETSNGGVSYGATTYSRGGELNYKNVYTESCTTN